MKRSFSLLASLIIAFLIPASSAIAATTKSVQPAIRGKVSDPAGLAVAGARVTVSAAGDARQFRAAAVTNENGEFSISVPAGSWVVTVEAPGFRHLVKTIGADTVDPALLSLELAEHADAITVDAPAGNQAAITSSATKTMTALRDLPQSITVVTQQAIRDQQMASIGDVVRYVPGITAIQGENNRDQLVIRGNSSSADFFVNGVRDDVQYYRDLYNLDRVEALRGPNAMIFGRGGGGGIINRVLKEAGFTPLREINLQTGSFSNRRATFDFDHALGSRVAFRLNGMMENSDSFRRDVDLSRRGINPTVRIPASQNTAVTLSYEYFRDHRVADRGIPSYSGRPLDVPISTYFGNPQDSRVRADVNLVSAAVEHTSGRLIIRNRSQFGDYDRFYQNYVPGAVSADRTQAALSGYNNATQRRNLFNQTDLIYSATTGSIHHKLLGGAEFGRQNSENFRNTGYFNNSATSIFTPLSYPVTTTPVTFRQSATDADNHVSTNVAAVYTQDQMEFSRYLQVITGVRFDRFALRYHNNRNSEELRRSDNLVSPRAGFIIKPIVTLSIYGNYSVSYLPSSGDQFSSLTTITQQVKPEKFTNYESGIKWDVNGSMSATAAVYRLDRTNTRSLDPNDPTRIVQTGSQRSKGFELGINGNPLSKWTVALGYANQNTYITSATASAVKGARVAQVPRNTFSAWNRYQIFRRLGLGIGVLNRSDMFAAIDDTVVLPGYTRADAAVFISLTERTRLQANVENLFNRRYFLNADSNNNISPGSSRTLRLGMSMKF